jgi:hypothetical protein
VRAVEENARRHEFDFIHVNTAPIVEGRTISKLPLLYLEECPDLGLGAGKDRTTEFSMTVSEIGLPNVA